MVHRALVLVLCLVIALHSVDSSIFGRNRTASRRHGNKPWFRTKLALGWWKFASSIFVNAARFYTRQARFDLFDTSNALPKHPESTMTPVEIIINRGYTAQVHTVTTDDGYILEVHRIPHGRGQSANAGAAGRPVFIQHGFLGSSADWLIGPNDRALAFKLADLGYDVWLGNCRGNTYSRKHKVLDPNEEPYWNFSWDEMGRFDIPAVIDYILQKTNRQKIVYIGYSMGCAMFFVCMSTRPDYNNKIEAMFALGPAVSLAHLSSPVIRAVAPFVKHFELLFRILRTRDLLSNDIPLNKLQTTYCLGSQQRALLCRNILFFIIGHDTRSVDLELLPIIDGHTPAGASVRTAAHFAMNFNSGQTFIPYDYGWLGNYRNYGSIRPPPYNLGQVTAAVHLFYADNDLLVRPEDVKWLAKQLPNVKQVTRIDDSQYNHFGFMWHTKNNELLNKQLISYLPAPN